MHQLTEKDFPGLDLGDIRRNNRFVSIINRLNEQPGSSIPKFNEGWYDTKATYNLFKSKAVNLSAIQQAICGYGSKQVEGLNKILIAHDISNISYNDLDAEGLGYLDNAKGQGILCYSSIAISTDGIPMSILYQNTWVRPEEDLGKSYKRKTRQFEEKESYEWYRGITEVNQLLGKDIEKIHICDRGADIYELFFSAFEKNTDLLIRSKHNRKLGDGSHLWDTVSQLPSAGTASLSIPDKTGKKREDIAFEVRYLNVEILRPLANKSKYESIDLTAIEIKQIDQLKDWQQESIHWQLLTTISINTVIEALQCVHWYCLRWLIERFHYVLKSGTKIEELQLKQAESLQKAVHTYSIVAMRIMQMVYLSRVSPKINCELVLTKEQWMTLYMIIHKTKEIPQQQPELGIVVKWIGKLGGHLGRKQDGEPGLKTVWRGYRKLCDATLLYSIMVT